MSDEQAAAYGAKLDFSNDMTYGDYLQLDKVLDAQRLLSGDHNELLFIIQHQTTELWMKLMLHELHAAREQIKCDALPPAFKMSARVSRILEQLVRAWDVLATLTPSEYSHIRPHLGHSSGFQSYQYRLIEFVLGNKNEMMLRLQRHRPDLHALLDAELHKPSLYDETIQLLARRGYELPDEVLYRDCTQPYTHHDAVEEAWLTVYQNPEEHWDLYEWAEELMDLEDTFRQWRFRHVTTVERIIGYKTGTGGTAGVGYLRNMLNVQLFPELWKVRTDL
jgi:tryptophan 2,3-dioxygenase